MSNLAGGNCCSFFICLFHHAVISVFCVHCTKNILRICYQYVFAGNVWDINSVNHDVNLLLLLNESISFSGGTYLSMFSLFLIPEKTLGYLIPETCDGIYQALKADHMKVQAYN